MSSLAEDLVEAGQLRPSERRRFVSTIHQAPRDGGFFEWARALNADYYQNQANNSDLKSTRKRWPEPGQSQLQVAMIDGHRLWL